MPPAQGDVKALDVRPLDASLLDAMLRLVRLLDSPTEARLLAPLVSREIISRLLLGAQGARLRACYTDALRDAIMCMASRRGWISPSAGN